MSVSRIERSVNGVKKLGRKLNRTLDDLLLRIPLSPQRGVNSDQDLIVRIARSVYQRVETFRKTLQLTPKKKRTLASPPKPRRKKTSSKTARTTKRKQRA